ALAIERDVFEAELLEDRHQLCRHLRRKRAIKLVARHLDADNLPMMAHAHLAEAQLAQGLLARFDGGERLSRNLTSIFNARPDTGRSRLGADAQPKLL